MSWQTFVAAITTAMLAVAAAAADEPEQPSGTTAPDRTVHVLDYRCGQMLRLSEDDRASAAMFYYGYLAAGVGLTTLDVSRIEDNVRRVMDRCAKAPDMTVVDSFKQEVGQGSR